MSALIAGIDLSSKAIHAALIPLDPDDGSDAPPVTLRSFDLPVFKPASTTPAFRSVERCRVIRDAMRDLLLRFESLEANEDTGLWESYEVVHVCVEEPFGPNRKADNVMREIFGAILASIPPHIERDTITTQEWRRLALPDGWGPWSDWKLAAIGEAYRLTGDDLNEHEAEAYLIARACRTRLDQAVNA